MSDDPTGASESDDDASRVPPVPAAAAKVPPPYVPPIVPAAQPPPVVTPPQWPVATDQTATTPLPADTSSWGPPTATVPPAFGAVAPSGSPTYAAGPLGSTPAVAPPTPKKNRTGLVVGLLVVLILVVGALLAVFLLVVDGSSDTALAVDSCEIAADGTLTATGSVAGGSGGGGDTSLDLRVNFVEVSSGDLVDSDSTTVQLSNGSGSWSASGAAGDSVDQVTCEATIGG